MSSKSERLLQDFVRKAKEGKLRLVGHDFWPSPEARTAIIMHDLMCLQSEAYDAIRDCRYEGN